MMREEKSKSMMERGGEFREGRGAEGRGAEGRGEGRPGDVPV
jgi:hypothetical protein